MTFERIHQGVSEKVSQAKERLPNIPGEIRIPTADHVMHPEEIVNAVKEYKQTANFRLLKRRGLNVVPTRTSKGVLLGVVGTAAAIGAGYMWYRRLKESIKTEEDPQSTSPNQTVLTENIPSQIDSPQETNGF